MNDDTTEDRIDMPPARSKGEYAIRFFLHVASEMWGGEAPTVPHEFSQSTRSRMLNELAETGLIEETRPRRWELGEKGKELLDAYRDGY